MAVGVGDRLPDVEIWTSQDGVPRRIRTGDVVGTGRSVRFGVPGAFTRAMDLELDGDAIGLGTRSMRYAAVIEDGTITSLDVEQASRGVDVSSCAAVLSKL